MTLLALCFGPIAEAQQTAPAPATPGTAITVGTVFDSLRMKPLANAVVRLDTSTLTSRTDSTGRFRLEGISPGPHSLRVEHPLMDTLGVTLRSSPENYSAGETKPQELATPAPETLLSILCSSAWRARGPAALMGRVYEADSGTPAVGAKVSLVWYEIDITGGVRKQPRVREAIVGKDGTYRICGLPPQLDGRAQVIRGPLTSGDIPITFGQDLLFLRSMSIAAADAVVLTPVGPGDSTSRKRATTVIGSARLSGRVLNKAGRPLAGARVQLEGTTRAATTRPTGEFTLDSLPSGTQTVSVRLLGYAPVEQAVDLTAREPGRVTLTMDNFVPVLETVRVNAQRERGLDDVGFARRKRNGMGWFMESDAIRSRNSQNFSDLLRGAPGIRVSMMNNRQIIESARDPMGGCVNVWIDGTQWQQMEPGDVDDFVKPHELAAIEVYSPTTTPAEYQPAGRSGCSTVIGWTTRRLDRKR